MMNIMINTTHVKINKSELVDQGIEPARPFETASKFIDLVENCAVKAWCIIEKLTEKSIKFHL